MSDTQTASRSRPLLTLIVGVLIGAVLVGIVGVALGFRRGGDVNGTTAGAIDPGTAFESPQGSFTGASSGAVELKGVRLTSVDDTSSGMEGDDRSRFAPGEGVRLWLDTAYSGSGGDVLAITWFRSDEELAASDIDLPQPFEVLNAALSRSQADRPGAYRVVISVNGEPLHEIAFVIS